MAGIDNQTVWERVRVSKCIKEKEEAEEEEAEEKEGGEERGGGKNI